MKKIFLGIVAGWALFLAAFVVAFVLIASCSPLFAQYDLENADIDPTEVIDILPEEPEEPPFFPPEEFPDFWGDDLDFLPLFSSVSRAFPALAQIDPIEIIDIEPDDPDDPPPPEVVDPESPSIPSDGWGELVLQALANLYPSGNYQRLQGRGGRILAAGIDSKKDLRVVDPENLQNQAVFDPETGDLKQFEPGADSSFISDDSDANLYDTYPDLEDWTASEVQNSSGGNGENQQQGEEQQPEVPEEFQSFSLWAILSPLVSMAVKGLAVFLGLYFGLFGIQLLVRWWRRHYSAGAKADAAHQAEMERLDSVSVSGDVDYLNEEGLDAYIRERQEMGL